MIYEYECQKCKTVQEKHVKLGQENKEACEKCKAPPKHLKRVLSAHAKMTFNWSKWSV